MKEITLVRWKVAFLHRSICLRYYSLVLLNPNQSAGF
jgi:hypothetical protein